MCRWDTDKRNSSEFVASKVDASSWGSMKELRLLHFQSRPLLCINYSTTLATNFRLLSIASEMKTTCGKSPLMIADVNWNKVLESNRVQQYL